MSNFGLRVAASTSRAVRAASRSCRVQSRALHQRRQLSYPVEEGLGTFLPPHSLKMLAEDYQQGLLDRLNDQVRGTSLENKTIVQTIIDSARDPDKVLEFNYASEALNNSFFLENLKPPPIDASSHEGALQASTSSSPSLIRRITYDYGSLAQFKSNFSAAVLGMFSSGWIWLVTDQDGQLGVVPTFGSGTLLVRSSKPSAALEEWQRLVGEPVLQYFEDLPPRPSALSSSAPSPAASSPVSGATHGLPGLDPHTQARTIASMPRPRGMYASETGLTLNATEPDASKVGTTLFPLLCVSVHEHAWVGAGYGVWGKEEYMRRFWSVVDWAKVVKVYEKVAKAVPK
ncbi:Manganese/iron superoxide dismutase [Ganoderma leucocontextum]|nr:Manganese/iron superoxide dismutase [Ganoderma leucocontextum]